jgi:hypothetical protein
LSWCYKKKVRIFSSGSRKAQLLWITFRNAGIAGKTSPQRWRKISTVVHKRVGIRMGTMWTEFSTRGIYHRESCG